MQPLDVSGLKQPVLSVACLFYSSLCYPWLCRFVCSTAVCAVPVCVCLSVLQQSVPPKVSGLEQLVLHLDVSVQHQHVLFHEVCSVWPTAAYAARGLSLYMTRAAPGRVCLKELLYAPGESFCCTYSCPSTRAFVLHMDVSVYKIFCMRLGCLSVSLIHVRLQELLCCTWTCLSTRALSCTCACL